MVKKKSVWIPERWVQVDLLSFVKYSLYKLIVGFVWEIDEVARIEIWGEGRSWGVLTFIYWLLCI